MKRLLIVSPHFPPTDTVDMHRVRMNVGHYRAHGWEPVVLAVAPEFAGRLQDSRLARTLPADVPIHRTGAVPHGLATRLGLSALGIRAYWHLALAGDKLLRNAICDKRPFDLAFISTTAFPAMVLGSRWKRRFGLPFVLDFQDPWATASATSVEHRRRGLKHGIMRGLHAFLEARTVPEASGLMVVSGAYIEALCRHYPMARSIPAEVIPFGYSVSDHACARENGTPWPKLAGKPSSNVPTGLFAGRLGKPFARSLQTLLDLAALAPSGTVLERMHLFFLGTGYQAYGNPEEVVSFTKATSMASRIVERPDRLPFLDAIRSLDEADLLIILGSEDLAYQPSKLHQYLVMNKPILIVAPAGSPLMEQTNGLASVIQVEVGRKLDSDAAVRLSIRLERALALDAAGYAERAGLGQSFEASTLARRECALFDAAHQLARPDLTHVEVNQAEAFC